MAAFFQTLRGKLILTYISVTVLALLALEVIILVAIFTLSRGLDSNTPHYLSDVVSVLAPRARPYLQPGAVDQAGLQNWLQATYDKGYASLPPQGIFDSPAAAILKSAPMYVLSADETVLAAVPAGAQGLVGRKYSPPPDVPRGAEILTHAQDLELDPDQVSVKRPDGNYLIAVPVRQSQGEGPLVGIVIVTVRPPPGAFGQSWPVIAGILAVTSLVLLITVAPLGALFGFIMSRGLSRRLKALTLAADAWSEGDFSAQPQDRSRDEISVLGMRLRRMAERVQALLQTRQELALLEERNRLARELHDTVKQETFATLMQVRAARNLLERDPQTARQRLDEAEELIKTSQQELGLIIAQLRPAELANQGLAGALGDYLTAWSQHSRIPVDFQVHDERRLPLETEQALFRVAQEALSNVARHSRASAAAVSLTFEPAQVTLTIRDNGIGFDPATTMRGFGLQSMQDRLAAIQGRLSFQSAPSDGTSMTAVAPTLQKE